MWITAPPLAAAQANYAPCIALRAEGGNGPVLAGLRVPMMRITGIRWLCAATTVLTSAVRSGKLLGDRPHARSSARRHLALDRPLLRRRDPRRRAARAVAGPNPGHDVRPARHCPTCCPPQCCRCGPARCRPYRRRRRTLRECASPRPGERRNRGHRRRPCGHRADRRRAGRGHRGTNRRDSTATLQRLCIWSLPTCSTFRLCSVSTILPALTSSLHRSTNLPELAGSARLLRWEQGTPCRARAIPPRSRRSR